MNKSEGFRELNAREVAHGEENRIGHRITKDEITSKITKSDH